MQKKGKIEAFVDKLPKWVLLCNSILLFVILWKIISVTERGRIVFASPDLIVETMFNELKKPSMWRHIGFSLFRVVSGYLLAFISAIPIAFLMGWYKSIRSIFEPWVQFIRSIPPIAYLPLVIVAVGVGESSKITVIFIGAFLVMLVTIYQGVLNVDETLIKAGKVLGASDREIFFTIVVPASLPFIMTALRLGLATSLTSLVAAEMTGASEGLGTMIQTAGQYFQMKVVLMGVLIIGILGMVLEKIIKIIDKKLTSWQEKREV
ncbi:MAG: ABC transporter permease [Sphaerochaetaceae bacterium]|jgi:NitT/TauT family transport system permease protein|nr:ABC transporter permease [Sphaerochaetaceae bacterium]NLO69954.1 ABC transporter permease [Porphyromonadaceae bacterium]